MIPLTKHDSSEVRGEVTIVTYNKCIIYIYISLSLSPHRYTYVGALNTYQYIKKQ